MNIPPAMSPRQPNTPSPVVLPDELIADILSWLPVKSLMRLRCVSKSWNALISDPTFVYMHLQRSKQNPHLTLVLKHSFSPFKDCSVVPFPVRRLLLNLSTTVPDDPCYRLNDQGYSWLVGSCNGLLCLLFYSFNGKRMYRQNWLCLWNPATGIRSENFGYFCDFGNPLASCFKFSFGYDNSTGTYKVVAFRVDGDEASCRSQVRVLCLGDIYWRNIQSFPVVPLNWNKYNQNDGVHFSGTLNWLALCNYSRSRYDWKDITVEQFVIVSLDLSRETYTQLLLPRGFHEVPRVEPTVGVLMDCLCFSHDFKGTYFVIWQMKEFGAQESWTQFLKISYQNLLIDNKFDGLRLRLLPLCLSKNGDTLILASDEEDQAIIYNWRDSRVERTRITNEILWFSTKDYVESLVWTR